MRPLTRLPLILISTLTLCPVARAEEGVLVVHVSAPAGRPIAGVVLATAGDGSTGAPSDTAGRTRIRLARNTRPGDRVKLTLIRPQDLVFISPLDGFVTVPCFDNNTGCFAEVVLGVKGSRELLENPQAVLDIVAKANRDTELKRALAAVVTAGHAPKPFAEPLAEAQRRASLEATAKALGLKLAEVEAAISDLKTTDPYALGIVALYEGKYLIASGYLTVAVEERRGRPDKSQLADAQAALGHALYGAGRYLQAAREYEEVIKLRPGDLDVLLHLSTALYQAGEYSRAELYFQRAVEVSGAAAPGGDQLSLLVALNGLGVVRHNSRRRYAEAEKRYGQALAIREKLLEPDDPDLATSLDNMGRLHMDRGVLTEAGKLLARALAIREKRLLPSHPDVARSHNNLGTFYYLQGKREKAEELFKRALAGYEKQTEFDHPDFAEALENYARLLRAAGRDAEVDGLETRAGAIRAKLK